MKCAYSILTVYIAVISFAFTGCQTLAPTASGLGHTAQDPSEETTFNASGSISEISPEVVFSSDQLKVTRITLEEGPVGGSTFYRINIRALDDVKNVRISQILPDEIQFTSSKPSATRTGNTIEWIFSSMKSGDNQTIDVTVQPMRKGTHEICSNVTFDNSFCFSFFSGQPKLNVIKQGPASIELGEIATWTVTVTNQGSAEAVNVIVTDALPDAFEPMEPLEKTIGTLVPGETRSVEYSAKAIRQGAFQNRAVVDFKGALSTIESESSVPITVVQSGIRIVKKGPEKAYVFKPERFEITIENTGDTDLKNVRITDILPERSFISNPGKGRVNENAIGWMIPYLPAGASQLITTEITATQPGVFTSMVTVQTANGLETSDVISTDWLAVPGVTVSISDSKDPIREKEPTTYRIRVRNQGNFEPVSGTVIVTFTESIKPTAIAGDSQGVINGQTVTFPRTTLEAGKDTNLVITAEGVTFGSGRAVLKFSADFLEKPIVSEEATNVY